MRRDDLRRRPSDPWSTAEGGATPEEGPARHFDMDEPEVPAYGYRVERRETDRVLYSFDVGGRTKAAVVVARDQRDRLYARDPESVLARDGFLGAPYVGRLRALPADAYDTGYRHRDEWLWLTPGRATAYVRTSHGVEAWPRLKAGVDCD
ncbi:hypothetical protein AB0F39_05505 [Streptomyces murinus]|uniref:hypothetical protein n=1 Tax=Streptomyces murinus TaxID=33900 RepID=UPI0033C314CE